jgi:hypothetical protein
MGAVADFQTALTAARTYIAADNYSAARKQLAIARAALAGIPNVGNDSTSVSWRTDLDALATDLDKLEADVAGTRTGLQYSKVTFKETCG